MKMGWCGGQRRVDIQTGVRSLNVNRGPRFHRAVYVLIRSLQEDGLGSQTLERAVRNWNTDVHGKIYLDQNALPGPCFEFMEFDSGCKVSYPVLECREIGDD